MLFALAEAAPSCPAGARARPKRCLPCADQSLSFTTFLSPAVYVRAPRRTRQRDGAADWSDRSRRSRGHVRGFVLMAVDFGEWPFGVNANPFGYFEAPPDMIRFAVMIVAFRRCRTKGRVGLAPHGEDLRLS